MADRINFSQQINDSVQIGDNLYFVSVNSLGESTGSVTELGLITDVGDNFVVIDASAPANFTLAEIESGSIPPLFMFRKNNQANVSTLVGYFADVTMTGNSSGRLELFNVGSEVFVSSK